MKLVDDFLKFERDNNLFEIKDKYGFMVWDTIRYCVGGQIIRNAGMGFSSNKENYNTSWFFAFKRIVLFIIYTICHIKSNFLFILTSRDYRDDEYMDVISDGLYELANKKNIYVLETTFNWDRGNYKYGKVSPSIFTLLLRLNKSNYDFSQIKYIVEQAFPNVTFNVREWESLYKMFITQYYFYNFFFKISKIRKVFYVQNGIYKGIVAAAKKNGITTIEFQHGQISRNHLMYSYHQCFSQYTGLYNPDMLLTFSPVWLNKCVLPGTRIIPVGNDFCHNVVAKKDNIEKKILVVSSIFHAKLLINLVKEISSIDNGFYFYYKLHPDEYKSFSYYRETLAKYGNVKIIADEYSISELLENVELSLVIQSTVMVETLDVGRTVFVYRKLDYEVMDYLFDEEGIYFFDDPLSFVECYNGINKKENVSGRFFGKFNRDAACKLFNETSDNISTF